MMKYLICILLCAPLSILTQNEFLKKYAGSYSIMVGNDGSEAYALGADGSAVWISGWKDSSGKPNAKKVRKLDCQRRLYQGYNQW